MRKIVTTFFKNFNGSWNLKDNSTIKETLAGMDCCSDSY